jgi:predicted dehydrogenase
MPGYFASRSNPAGNAGRWGLDIYGTEGIVTIRMASVPEIRVLQSPSWTGKEADWQPLPDAPEVSFDNRVGYYKPIVDGLIAAIESGNEPLASLKDGRNALEMVQAAFACPKNGGRVEMPLKEREHPLANWS